MRQTASPTPSGDPDARYSLPYELVLENTVVGLSYIRGRRFLWTNARLAEIFGYAENELDGQSVRLLYSSEKDFRDVGHMYMMHAHDNFYSHERQMAKKDGSSIWCRMSGRLIDGNDSRAASVWVVQDISARKAAEDQLRQVNQDLESTVTQRTAKLQRTNEALRKEVERRRALQARSVESREKYRALLRHYPLGIIITDSDANVIEMNRAMQALMGGQTQASMTPLMRAPERVVCADGTHCSLTELVQRFAPSSGRRVKRVQCQWLKPNGRLIALQMAAARLPGHGLGAVFTFEDITQQLAAREREQEQQNALAHATRLSLMGQFTAALAHELGQPLNACQSYLAGIRYRLGEELADKPDLLAALDQIGAHLQQANQIVRNVRQFVSRHAPEFEPVDLRALISETLALLKPQLRDGHASIDMEIAERLPHAFLHRVEIQQVLVNLIINAVDAMQDVPLAQRRITICASRATRSMLSVSIADQGPGVPEPLLERIFEPYFTTKASGLGMGLMMCQTIVESHGGTLRCGAAAGGGALFNFTLPVAKVRPAGPRKGLRHER